MTGKAIFVCAWTALLGALASGCGDHDVYVIFERYELVDGERKPAGAGCVLAIDKGFGAGTVSTGSGLAAPGGDLAISERLIDDAWVVVVTSQGEELERRAYSERQLLSGERDEFTITTHAGRTFELAYWGGTRCRYPRQTEEE